MSRREFGTSRIGRGGAGNIDTAAKENARIAEDLEASQSAADSFAQTSSPTDYLKRQEPSYVGRGGAGNYGGVKEADHWADLGRAEEETFAKIRRDSQPQSPTYGRGGAGNYAAGTAEGRQNIARKRTEDEIKSAKLKEEVEKGVQEQLAMPQKAKLPGGNPY